MSRMGRLMGMVVVCSVCKTEARITGAEPEGQRWAYDRETWKFWCPEHSDAPDEEVATNTAE